MTEKLFTTQEVIDLFNKFEQDRNCYYAEDAATLVPLDEWLKENVLHEKQLENDI